MVSGSNLRFLVSIIIVIIIVFDETGLVDSKKDVFKDIVVFPSRKHFFVTAIYQP